MNKSAVPVFLAFLLLLTGVLNVAYANVWSSPAVFEFDDGSKLGLADGLTVSYENSSRDGTTVTINTTTTTTAFQISGGDVTLQSFSDSQITFTVVTDSSMTVLIYSSNGYAEVNGGDFDPTFSVSYPTVDTTKIVIDAPASKTVSFAWTSTPVDPDQVSANSNIFQIFWLTMTILSFLPILLSFAAFSSFRSGNLNIKLVVAAVSSIVVYIILMLITYSILINMGNAL
jgi:hypothetical protein